MMRYLKNSHKMLFMCVLFCCVKNLVQCQNDGLFLCHQQKNKEKIIKEEKFIIVKTDDDIKYTGEFEIVNDSSICIKNDTIQLRNIAFIKPNNRLQLIIGMSVVAFGVAFMPLDLFFTLFTGQFFYHFTMFAIIPITIGSTILAVSPAKKVKKGWKITVKKY